MQKDHNKILQDVGHPTKKEGFTTTNDDHQNA